MAYSKFGFIFQMPNKLWIWNIIFKEFRIFN